MPGSGRAAAILQRRAHFFARLAHAGKNNAIAAHADAAKMVEFAARDDVEAAA